MQQHHRNVSQLSDYQGSVAKQLRRKYEMRTLHPQPSSTPCGHVVTVLYESQAFHLYHQCLFSRLSERFGITLGDISISVKQHKVE